MSLADFFTSRKNKMAEGASSEKNVEELPPFSRSILVVVDGSPSSRAGLDYAMRMAASLPGCLLNVAAVIDTASMDLLQQMHIMVQEERIALEEEMEGKGQALLETAEEQCRKCQVQVATYMLKGRISQVVLKAVRELCCDLLVIGGWHDGSTRKDNPSVERQLIVDQVDCPVIIIKHKR